MNELSANMYGGREVGLISVFSACIADDYFLKSAFKVACPIFLILSSTFSCFLQKSTPCCFLSNTRYSFILTE